MSDSQNILWFSLRSLISIRTNYCFVELAILRKNLHDTFTRTSIRKCRRLNEKKQSPVSIGTTCWFIYYTGALTHVPNQPLDSVKMVYGSIIWFPSRKFRLLFSFIEAFCLLVDALYPYITSTHPPMTILSVDFVLNNHLIATLSLSLAHSLHRRNFSCWLTPKWNKQ